MEGLTTTHLEGYRAAIIFVVQRDDAMAFRSHWKTGPAFDQALCQVLLAGVEVQAHTTPCQEGMLMLKRRLALRLEE